MNIEKISLFPNMFKLEIILCFDEMEKLKWKRYALDNFKTHDFHYSPTKMG